MEFVLLLSFFLCIGRIPKPNHPQLTINIDHSGFSEYELVFHPLDEHEHTDSLIWSVGVEYLLVENYKYFAIVVLQLEVIEILRESDRSLLRYHL